MEAGYADWRGLQEWTFAEVTYFVKGHYAHQRERDRLALQIAGAAQNAETYQQLFDQLDQE